MLEAELIWRTLSYIAELHSRLILRIISSHHGFTPNTILLYKLVGTCNLVSVKTWQRKRWLLSHCFAFAVVACWFDFPLSKIIDNVIQVHASYYAGKQIYDIYISTQYIKVTKCKNNNKETFKLYVLKKIYVQQNLTFWIWSDWFTQKMVLILAKANLYFRSRSLRSLIW